MLIPTFVRFEGGWDDFLVDIVAEAVLLLAGVGDGDEGLDGDVLETHDRRYISFFLE